MLRKGTWHILTSNNFNSVLSSHILNAQEIYEVSGKISRIIHDKGNIPIFLIEVIFI